METLLIHYRPCDRDHVSWCLLDASDKTGNEIQHGKLADLEATAKGRRATVLIDSSCTSIESVQVPSNNRQRQLQAVPYALEDCLASDVDKMHFALGKKQADDRIPVITIDKGLFESTLDRFRQANVTVETLSADCLALPIKDDSWTVLIHNQNVLIKTSSCRGYFCDRDLLPTLLPALMEQADQPPQSIQFFHEHEDVHAADLLGATETALNIQTYEQHPLHIFAENLRDTQEINLLQGKFAPRRESNALLKPWKAVAAIALVWTVLQLIHAGFEIRQLQYENRLLTGTIEKQFKRVLPGARKFTNMKNRVERRLRELRGGGGKDDEVFLELLAGAATSFGNKQITIHGMAYNNKRIDMEIQAKSLQELEAIKSQLNGIKTMKTTLSTSVEKDKVKGRLRLEKQS